MEEVFELLVGGGVLTTFAIFAWQSHSAAKAEDERMLAQARVLLARLINLQPNDQFSAIHGGDPHKVGQSVAVWKREIADARVELENAALAIRSKKLRPLAARILEVAEPPLDEWNEDLAGLLMGQIKVVLGPDVVDARKDPYALGVGD